MRLLLFALLATSLARADEFDIPPAYAAQLGAYPSPLRFYDGTPVISPADWPRRRAEILQRWHGLMGAWPPLLQHPKVEELTSEPRENFTQKRLRIQIAPDQTTEAILLLPPGGGKFPAVLVPYYEPETSVGLGKEERDFALQLTRRGFVTLSIGSPGGDARKPVLGAATCQPLSYLAYIAANCATLLTQLPQVDPARLGVVGHSYGGKWAMFASCLCEKFACAVWSDPGIVWDETDKNINYWDPWYLGAQPGPPRPIGLPSEKNPRTGAYRNLVENGLDLTDLHALMAPRSFLVSGGAQDKPTRWIALNHAVAVNQFLGYTRRVALTAREGHPPTPESNARLYAFFEHFLK